MPGAKEEHLDFKAPFTLYDMVESKSLWGS
jgi:hypothetical protein